MAVIGRRAFVLASLLACGMAARADDSADVHKVIGDVADALSSGEVTQALAGFDKKFVNYQKLSDYFEALTNAYFVENTVDFMDEDVSASAATVMVRWDLAVTTKQSGITKNRSAELTMRLVREGKKWRIMEFGPIGMFDPQGL
jgi:hypothetical protein